MWLHDMMGSIESKELISKDSDEEVIPTLPSGTSTVDGDLPLAPEVTSGGSSSAASFLPSSWSVCSMESTPPRTRFSSWASILFRPGGTSLPRADRGHDIKTTPPITVNDHDFFSLIPPPFDIRSHLRIPILLLILSPFVFNLISFRTCMAALVGVHAVPEIVRLRYSRFMEMNIIDDLRIEPGACLSILASTTALLLETHHSSISLAVKFHPEFYNRPLTRLLRTFLFVEMVFNGTSEEKDQTASWLRWIHRHMHGTITDDMREKLEIPEGVMSYGYTDELKAWVMFTLTWSTIAFQTRFGRPLTKRALDTIVLENTCAALRIGIPERLLAKDYDSFLTLFNAQLNALSPGSPLTHTVVKNVEDAAMLSKMHWITKIWIRLALMVGHDLLPHNVRNAYQLQILNTWWNRVIQRFVMFSLWLVYPMLMWLPLRGVICLLLVLEPQLWSVFKTSLHSIHSMDILSDEPQNTTSMDLAYSNQDNSASYLSWLESGKESQTFLQRVVIKVLRAQIGSGQAQNTSTWAGGLIPWILLSWRLCMLIIDVLYRSSISAISNWRTQISESMLFRGDDAVKVPQHIGLVMDGNRRYARNLGKPVILGHQRGAQTAGNVLGWWLRLMPSTSSLGPRSDGKNITYLTVWAFSSDNLKRSAEEVGGLFRLMCSEFKSLALTSIVHLFQVRVRVIGNLDGFPTELLESISFLENATRTYSRLNLQIAVGYGGRDEVVRSVNNILETGGKVTEGNISENTFCARAGIPPVDLIVRTSERRTSGFFLWDTQGAELYFIDKLWPQLTEVDWLGAVASYSRREMRAGK